MCSRKETAWFNHVSATPACNFSDAQKLSLCKENCFEARTCFFAVVWWIQGLALQKHQPFYKPNNVFLPIWHFCRSLFLDCLLRTFFLCNDLLNPFSFELNVCFSRGLVNILDSCTVCMPYCCSTEIARTCSASSYSKLLCASDTRIIKNLGARPSGYP